MKRFLATQPIQPCVRRRMFCRPFWPVRFFPCPSQVKKLSNKGLASLVLKVKQVKAQSIKNLPDEKMQIRVDDFERSEFNQISQHVDEILFQEMPNKR